MPTKTTHIYDHIGTFHFFERYIIGEPNSETEMVNAQAKPLIDQVKANYQIPFFYIGNRINRNSVNPVSISQVLVELPMLMGIGIVCHHTSTQLVVDVEKTFVPNIPYQAFTALDDAIAWGLNILNERTE